MHPFGSVIVDNLKRNIPMDSIQCEKCGERFKMTYPNQKLCDTCSTYQKQVYKTIKCIDCDKEFDVEAKDNKTCRCVECTKIHRTNYQRELMRKRRKC